MKLVNIRVGRYIKIVLAFLFVIFPLKKVIAQHGLSIESGPFYRPTLIRSSRPKFQESDKSTLKPSFSYSFGYLYGIKDIRFKFGIQRSILNTEETFKSIGLDGNLYAIRMYQVRNTSKHLILQVGLKGKKKLEDFLFLFTVKPVIDEKTTDFIKEENGTRQVNSDSIHKRSYRIAQNHSVAIGLEWKKEIRKNFEIYSTIEADYRLPRVDAIDLFPSVPHTIYKSYDYNLFYLNFSIGCRYYFTKKNKIIQ